MIDTREELTIALFEAAELEHGLLAQYLFAAFTLKRREDEGMTALQQMAVENWARTILQVAHQEMYHLANVCNLLSAIGAAPCVNRPNFPQAVKKYYPFDFQLERFNDSSMYRFIVFELPEGETAPPPPGKAVPSSFSILKDFDLLLTPAAAPDPLVYNHVGELYRLIKDGIGRIPEEELFIGPKTFQDTEDWGLRLKLRAVYDRQSAYAVIDDIVLEGEGSPAAREGSHYDRFLKMRKEFNDFIVASPTFDPARRVAPNPATRRHRDAGGTVTLVTHPISLEAAEFFNDVYSTMLVMLLQYFSYGGESREQRIGLRDASRRLMSAAVRPIAEVLTELPVSTSSSDGQAGPGFEIYAPISLAPDVSNRWPVLRERLERSVIDAKALANSSSTFSCLSRLARVGDALNWTKQNLANLF